MPFTWVIRVDNVLILSLAPPDGDRWSPRAAHAGLKPGAIRTSALLLKKVTHRFNNPPHPLPLSPEGARGE